MRHAAANITEELFPEQLQIGVISVPLKYRFEPGHQLDGVTAIVPLHVLNQLDPATTDWLVPGMIRDKVTHLVKALPKTIRRVCVPVPDFVTKFLEQARSGEEPIGDALAKFITRQAGLVVSADDWNGEKLPDHLSMNFQVVDDAGQELATGRDWNALKNQLGQAAQLTFRANTPGIEREGLKQWDFGDLPGTLTFTRDGSTLTGYPAVEDNDDSVAIRLYDTSQAAEEAHRAGVRRLMRFELKEQMKQLDKGLPGFTQYALLLRNVVSPDDLREDMLTAIADRAFIGEDPLPRSNDEFMKLKQRARTRLPAVTEAITRQAQNIAIEYQALIAKLAQPGGAARIKAEIELQLRKLLYKGFFAQTPWENIQHLPRYLKAMRMRMDKYPSNPDRDTKHAYSVMQFWQDWEADVDRQRKAGRLAQGLLGFRWLIEELRVSLFAQELKTPFPVSFKRLEKAWNEL
jgi:ATP-dependent helicase HrpA